MPGGVRLLPPIAGGDVLRLPLESGDVVGIIDGYFHHVPAVRHKELLHILAHGVRVVGGASIGALRAAELDVFGMEGVGQIYADFRDGVIDGDDEVALMHAPSDAGYRPHSVPLVDVRATLAAAEDAGVCDRNTRLTLIDALSSLSYAKRTYAHMIAIGHKLGLRTCDVTAVESFIERYAVNQKRADALLVVQSIMHDAPDCAAPAVGAFELNETIFLYSWRLESNRSQVHIDGEDVDVSDLAALRVLQLFAHDYAAFYRRWALRWIVEECERDCGSSSVGDDPRELVNRAIDHGIHRGLYADPAGESGKDVAWLSAWTTEEELRSCDVDELLAHFLVRSYRVAPGIVPDEPALAQARRCTVFRHATQAACLSDLMVTELQQRYAHYHPADLDETRIAEWLAQRWRVPVDGLELAAFERGLNGRAGLIAAARPLYVFAKYNPTLVDLLIEETL